MTTTEAQTGASAHAAEQPAQKLPAETSTPLWAFRVNKEVRQGVRASARRVH